jgi:hypothetical protein
MPCDLFKDMFRIIQINDKFCLREPSTGVFTQAVRKVKLITDSEGNYYVSQYHTIYVLACIHTLEKTECGESIASIFYRSFKGDDTLPPMTVEKLFYTLPDEEFLLFLNEVSSQIPMHKMREWFSIIDSELMITAEKKEQEKND